MLTTDGLATDRSGEQMRVLQIDRDAPQSEDLPLHPRLTVVVGAGPGLVARMRAFFDALADRSAGAVGLDAVLELGSPRWHPSTGVPSPPHPTPPGPPPPGPGLPPGAAEAAHLPVVDPGAAGRELAARELERLTLQLRSAAGERTVLERRIVDVRVDLDPFASASLEAARANVADLARRHDEALARSAHASQVAERAQELRRELAGLDERERRLAASDPTALRSAADALEDALSPRRHPDVAAAELAERIEAHAVEQEAERARRDALEELIAEARARLDEALAALEVARAGRPTGADAELVARLEEVRDLIFDAEGVSGRSPERRSRRVHELRAEEAELLDRLGFDTYTEYVMSAHSVTAREARAGAVELAEARAELIRAEVERLAALVPAPVESEDRSELLADVAELTSVDPEGLARLTDDELVALLRERSVEEPPRQESVHEAVERLAALLSEAGSEPRGGPDQLLVLARELAAAAGDTRDARRALAEERARLSDELDTLGATVVDASYVDEELGELERAIAAARERVADDEARLERHEAAVSRLAELRAEDLRLAEREEELRVQVEEHERVVALLGGAGRSLPSEGFGDGPLVSGVRAVEADVSEAEPASRAASTAAEDDVTAGITARAEQPAAATTGARTGLEAPPGLSRERRVVERAAELRAVPGVGAVPMLVLGVDADGEDGEALLRRLQRLSELIQLVVTTDDEQVASWAEGLGDELAMVVRP